MINGFTNSMTLTIFCNIATAECIYPDCMQGGAYRVAWEAADQMRGVLLQAWGEGGGREGEGGRKGVRREGGREG